MIATTINHFKYLFSYKREISQIQLIYGWFLNSAVLAILGNLEEKYPDNDLFDPLIMIWMAAFLINVILMLWIRPRPKPINEQISDLKVDDPKREKKIKNIKIKSTANMWVGRIFLVLIIAVVVMKVIMHSKGI